MKTATLASLGVSLCLLIAQKSSGQPPTFVAITPRADTYIVHEDPDANFGNEVFLQVYDLSFPNEANTVLRFNVSDWSPYYNSLACAYLYLRVYSLTGGFDPEVERVTGSGTTWPDTYPTWNNFRNYVSWGISGYNYLNSEGERWQRWNVGDIVFQWLSGGYQMEGLSIVWPYPSVDFSAVYYSRENPCAFRPFLFMRFASGNCPPTSPDPTVGPCPPPTFINRSEEIPSSFGLHQNHPNPFNPTTSIRYELSKRCQVLLSVSDLLGREVTTLLREIGTAGQHEVQWNAENLSSGMYFYRLIAIPLDGSQPFVQTRKMILLR